jgi:hypothetical protein
MENSRLEAFRDGVFDFADRLDGGNDLINDFGSPCFGKVGDAFDELGHGRLLVGWSDSLGVTKGNYKDIYTYE